MFTLTHKGLLFAASTARDEDMHEPWKEHDGHGLVSDWTTRGKRPGERVLVSEGYSFRYYDVEGSVPIAKRDGWGMPADWHAAHPNATPGEIVAAAVASDFERLRAWCNDEWYWEYLRVTLLDIDGESTKEREYLSGIESDSARAYFEETARDLADEIATRIGRKKILREGARSIRVRK